MDVFTSTVDLVPPVPSPHGRFCLVGGLALLGGAFCVGVTEDAGQPHPVDPRIKWGLECLWGVGNTGGWDRHTGIY